MASSNDLVDLIENTILKYLSNTHTHIVAKITKINDTTVDVKPVDKAKKTDGIEVEYPVFPKVPPFFLYGGVNNITFPLAVGDDVLLMINERSLDNWYNGLDNKAPLEYRMFDFSDSFALVGIKPKKKAFTIPKDGRTHQTGDTLATGNYEQIGDYTRVGNMTMTGNFTLNGNLIVNGNINVVGGDLTVEGISFLNHTHPQNNGNDAGGGVNTSKPSAP